MDEISNPIVIAKLKSDGPEEKIIDQTIGGSVFENRIDEFFKVSRLPSRDEDPVYIVRWKDRDYLINKKEASELTCLFGEEFLD